MSVVTFVLIGVIVFFSRHELLHAFHLLGQVNLWILALLIPVQLLMYYSGGEMMFSYLRAKKATEHIAPLTQARMALELNFVNHVLPSAGVSGMSYMSWRLAHYHVPAGRTTMAQVVRFATGYASFITLLMIAVLLVTIDGHLNRWIILVSTTLVVLMVTFFGLTIYLISSTKRMNGFADWASKTANHIVWRLTRGRKRVVLRAEPMKKFFADMHHDYLELTKDKKLLIRPYLWGLVFTLTDIGVFWVTFWALGQPVNPAPILIAYGVATMAGFVMVTPGGAGAYEALMVMFLAIAGLDQGTAIAGTVLTRVILLMTTIIFGYIFYQHALVKYGRNKK